MLSPLPFEIFTLRRQEIFLHFFRPAVRRTNDGDQFLCIVVDVYKRQVQYCDPISDLSIRLKTRFILLLQDRTRFTLDFYNSVFSAGLAALDSAGSS